MNKGKILFVVVFVVVVSTVCIIILPSSEHAEGGHHELSGPTAEPRTSEKRGEAAPEPVSAAVSESSLDKRMAVYNLLNEMPTVVGGEFQEDIPADKMISREEARSIAHKNARPTSNATKETVVVFKDGYYVALMERHPNPFLAGGPSLDCKIGIDAETGEVIALLRHDVGFQTVFISPHTGTGKVGDGEIALKYQERVLHALKDIAIRVSYGQPLIASPKDGMVEVGSVVGVAKDVVADLEYNRATDPFVVLSGDVYIVTFWRADAEHAAKGAPTYAVRVGVDAYTGDFLAMEVVE